MNDSIARVIVVTGLVLAGGAVAMTVQRHEETIASGRVVLLELEPVDPRSLMQGDYMALYYKVARSLEVVPDDGNVVVKIDEHGVGNFDHVDHGRPLAADEARIPYRLRHGRARLASDAWFFEEGHSRDFAAARYGEFRVAPDGDALLVAMRDKNLQKLGS